MKSLIIYLETPTKVKKFVSIISKFDCDADLRSGRYVVNAKSILGIFSLDLKLPIVLEIHNGDCKQLIDEIIEFTNK